MQTGTTTSTESSTIPTGDQSYPSADGELICAFCSKSNKDVAILIAGPKAFICDECILVAMQIIVEQTRRAAVIKFRRIALEAKGA